MLLRFVQREVRPEGIIMDRVTDFQRILSPCSCQHLH